MYYWWLPKQIIAAELTMQSKRILNQVRRRAFGDLNHDISVSGAALTVYFSRTKSRISRRRTSFLWLSSYWEGGTRNYWF
jgi:hypothetical protein